MSRFFFDLLNRTEQLGRVQGDLHKSRAGEMDMLNLYNKADREAREWRTKAREAQSELEKANRKLWEMHAASDSFRLLSRKYGMELGVSQEQRILDRHEITLDLAEQEPGIANTEFAARAREALGKK